MKARITWPMASDLVANCVAERTVEADIELCPLSSINCVLEQLEHGDVASRVVLDAACWGAG